MEELVGQVLEEKYFIEKQLGHGGMGAVYRALHLGTTRPVAIKVIAPQYMAREEFVQRFRREAEATGRLRHPNVVNITDFGFATIGPSRIAYLVMEYLDGYTLADLLSQRGQLPLEMTVDIVEQICLAIEKAHQQGIIHRDLKPDNIWLEPDERGGFTVKVLDFGLAKLRSPQDVTSNSFTSKKMGQLTMPSGWTPTSTNSFDSDNYSGNKTAPKSAIIKETPNTQPAASVQAQVEAQNSDEEQTQVQMLMERSETGNLYPTAGGITQAGAVLGTPLYMSPEQCLGRELDARSDIYSLGVITYQMLAGETPFKGDSKALLVHQIKSTPVSVREKRRDLPREFAELIMSALAKDPEKRPLTARSFAYCLRFHLEGEAPIMAQAKTIYRQFRFTLLLISLITYLPILLLISILTSINNNFIWLSLPLLAIGHSFNIAGCTLLIDGLSTKNSTSIKPWSIITQLARNKFPLLLTSLCNSFYLLINSLKFLLPGLFTYINSSLYSPIVIIEGKQGKTALNRAKTLVNKLRYPVTSILIHELLITLMVFVTFVLADTRSFISKYSFISAETFSVVVIIAIAKFLPPLIIVLGYSPYAIAIVLLYFRARQASGEVLDETFNQDLSFLEQTSRHKVSYRRTVEYLTGFVFRRIIILLATITIFIVLFLVPLLVISYMQSPLVLMSQLGITAQVKVLLDSGANVNLKDNFGRTPLIAASQEGHTEITKILLEKGAEVNTRGIAGNTALIMAAESGQNDIVQTLIEKRAEIDAQNNHGDTSLMRAAEKGYSNIVKILIKAGANVHLKNHEGKTALMMVNENREIIDILKANGAIDESRP